MCVNTIQKDEFMFASMLCRELDRYLFADGKNGCLIHQPVLCGKTKNQPDGYGAKLTTDQPLQPIMVYGFKEEDYETAINESLGYCQVIVSELNDFLPIFIIPCSKTDLSLSLCWPINQKYLTVINFCKVDNSHKFANFFMQ